MPLFGRPSAEDDQRAAAWRDWVQQRNPFAIASLAIGIFSLIEAGVIPFFSIGAVVLGFLAISQLNHGKDNRTLGRRLAIAGIILGALSLCISIYIYTYPLRH
jgi:hypothetical protein